MSKSILSQLIRAYFSNASRLALSANSRPISSLESNFFITRAIIALT